MTVHSRSVSCSLQPACCPQIWHLAAQGFLEKLSAPANVWQAVDIEKPLRLPGSTSSIGWQHALSAQSVYTELVSHMLLMLVCACRCITLCCNQGCVVCLNTVCRLAGASAMMLSCQATASRAATAVAPLQLLPPVLTAFPTVNTLVLSR